MLRSLQRFCNCNTQRYLAEIAMARHELIIYTGNLNKIQEVVIKRHKNSAAEITTALKLLSNSTPFSATGNILFPPDLEHEETSSKSDMKTTLKIFLNTFSITDVDTALQACLTSLCLDSISQLIIAFPFESEDMTDDEWMAHVTPLWKHLEEYVEKGSVHALGVSDLNLDRLQLLFESAAQHGPSINHYSIDGCCTVPVELVEYAKAHDIQLLTHNDARVFELEEEVNVPASKITGFPLQSFTSKWTARYTVWLRSRSVVAGKGYLIQFEKN